MCDNLQHLCNEAKLLDDEPDEESKKLHKAETDLLSALQRVSFVSRFTLQLALFLI
jgi:hypothetical protein